MQPQYRLRDLFPGFLTVRDGSPGNPEKARKLLI